MFTAAFYGLCSFHSFILKPRDKERYNTYTSLREVYTFSDTGRFFSPLSRRQVEMQIYAAAAVGENANIETLFSAIARAPDSCVSGSESNFLRWERE